MIRDDTEHYGIFLTAEFGNKIGDTYSKFLEMYPELDARDTYNDLANRLNGYTTIAGGTAPPVKKTYRINPAEAIIGGVLLFAGVAFLAGASPKFARMLNKITGAKF